MIRQIRICGLGGQGIVLAGTILGQAAVYEGHWASGSNSYGSQARGGLANSEVVISDLPVKFPHVIESDILIALSQSSYEKYILSMKESGAIVVYDDFSVVPQDKADIEQIPISAAETAISELKNKQTANMAILAAAAKIAEIVSKVPLRKAIEESVSQKYLELNLKALELGWKMGEKASLK